jgi:hypothetical protein
VPEAIMQFLLEMLLTRYFDLTKTNTSSSVADPGNFGVDPDPGIHASD